MGLIIINEFRCSRSQQPLQALQNSRQKVIQMVVKNTPKDATTTAKEGIALPVEAVVPTEATALMTLHEVAVVVHTEATTTIAIEVVGIREETLKQPSCLK